MAEARYGRSVAARNITVSRFTSARGIPETEFSYSWRKGDAARNDYGVVACCFQAFAYSLARIASALSHLLSFIHV